MNTPIQHNRYYIGGGNVAGILGVSPYRTPLDEYLTIIGEADPPSEEQAAFFARRKALEPLACELFEQKTGLKIVERNVRSQLTETISAEIDARTADANIEIKTCHPARAQDWGEDGTGDAPTYVVAQAMHGLAVTGRDLCYILAMIGFDDVRVYTIKRDAELIDAILEEENNFWHDHVLRRNPPPPKTLEDVQRVFRNANGRPVELSSESAEMVEQLRVVRAEIRSLQTREKDLQFGIARDIWQAWQNDPRMVMHVPTAEELYAQDDAELRYQGKTIATWKKQTRRALDTKALTEAHPDIAAQFTKQSQFRVMRIAK